MDEFGINNIDLENIIKREDGTFEVTRLDNGWPYHVTPEFCPTLYGEVVAFLEAPEA